MINEDLIKQIFFYCDNNDPNGLYTDPQGEPLDIVEYARKIEAVISDSVRLKEHARCTITQFRRVEIVGCSKSVGGS
jgi:hypothetical protein